MWSFYITLNFCHFAFQNAELLVRDMGIGAKAMYLL